MKSNKIYWTVGAMSGLCALFLTASASIGEQGARAQDLPHSLQPAPIQQTRPSLPANNGPAWGVDYEEDMRRDIRALTSFIVNDLGPVAEQSQEQALVVESLRGFDAALNGCYGPAGLADYAWALNHALDEALPLFTMLEVMAEREENFPTGKDSATRLRHYHELMEKMESHYTRAARWLWEVNAAFAKTYPEAGEQIEMLREQGKIEGDLQSRAGADFYTGAYPFAVTTPLRNRAQIFGPYVTLHKVRQPATTPGVCPQ